MWGLAGAAALAAAASGQRARYEVDGRTADDAFGRRLAGLGDLDGDGAPDFAASAPEDSTRAPLAGCVSVHSGRSGLLLYRVEGAGADDWFGATLAEVDDLDGDGHRDLLIGAGLAPSAPPPAGRVEVRSGFDGALLYTLHPASAGAGVTTFGDHLGGAGDVDRDGRGDLFVRATGAGWARIVVVSGATGAVVRTHGGPTTFGLGAASVMDQDGDGVRELVVSDAAYLQTGPTVRGRVCVFSGRTGATLHTYLGDELSDNLGATIADAGDVDRDGVGDVALSVGNGTHHSRVWVVSGARAALLRELPERDLDDNLGAALARAGDVDGDGYEDLAVGAPQKTIGAGGRGAAYVYSGASGVELFRVDGAALRDRTGSAVLGAGDLGGDGRSEVLIGVPRTPGESAGAGLVRACGLDQDDVVLDFELDDDGLTPLENGRALGAGARFDRIVGLSGSGSGHFGPATFDSSPTGPNASGPDPDLLVDRGNLVILQRRPEQTVPGIFDVPDDAEGGGTLHIELLMPARPISLDLVDLDDAPYLETAAVRLVTTGGAVRTYTVPGGFTGDRTHSPAEGVQRLDLETLFPQPGHASTATAVEDVGFDAADVVRIELIWSGSGACDALRLRPLTSPPVPLRTIHTILPTVPGHRAYTYGLELESAGDVDGDGFDDLMVAHELYLPSVEVRSGADGGLLRTIVGPYESAFGRSLVGGIDVDRDSLPDLVIGAPYERDPLGVEVGAVHAYSGRDGAQLWRLLGTVPNANFGVQLAALGDVDGDGVGDLAIRTGVSGTTQVVSGADGATLWQIQVAGHHYSRIGSGADLDRDGRWDLLVLQQVGDGVLQAYSGVTGALILERFGTPSEPWVAISVEGLDDSDGDGVDEVVVGVSIVGPRSLRVLSGANFVDTLFTLRGEGRVVGDLDGDGWRDLVTTWLEFNPIPAPGTVTAGYSGRSGASLFRDVRLEWVDVRGLSPAGDADADGFADFARRRMDPELVSQEGFLVEILTLARANGAPVCHGAPNSTGFRAVLRARGSFAVSENELRFTATGLPSGALTLLLSSPSYGLASSPVIGGAASIGDLCLAGGPISRHGTRLAMGLVATFPLDLGALATVEAPGGVAAATVGETRYWQCWYRDSGAAGRSSFSDAIRVTFE